MRVFVALLTALLVASAQASTGVPAFTVQAPNGQTSILIGSVHFPHPLLRQPAASVLDRARVLVVEHASSDERSRLELAPEVLAALSRGIDRRAAWAESFTREQLERISRNLKCPLAELNMSDQYELLFKLKSPAALSVLAYIPCNPANMLSRDGLMNQAAGLRHIPTVTLESPEEIRARRKTLPDRLYASALIANAALDLEKTYRSLVDAVNKGDFVAVAAINRNCFADRDAGDLFHRVMLQERNVAWLPSLRSELDQGSAVIVVGAAHLPGEDGVIALLDAAGYRVAPTNLPSSN